MKYWLIGLYQVFALELKEHTVSVRLSEADFKHYQRILARFGSGSTNSERFRSMLVKLDLPYASRFDNDEWSFEETCL